MRRICIFTATRAEWGLLRGVAEKIRGHENLELQLLVSGTHLSQNHGMTVSEIEADGYEVSERIPILKHGDSPEGICKIMGEALADYGEAFSRLKPDIILVLGDRYETFCAAAIALNLIPFCRCRMITSRWS